MNRHHVSSHAQRIKKDLLLVLKKHDLVIVSRGLVCRALHSAKPHQGGVKQRRAALRPSLHYFSLLISTEVRPESRARRIFQTYRSHFSV